MSGQSGDVTLQWQNEQSHHQLNPYDNNLQLSNSKTNNVYDVSGLEEQLRGSYFKEDKKEVTSDKQEENVYNTIPAAKEFTLDPDLLKRPLPKRPNQDGVYTKVVNAQVDGPSSKTGFQCSRRCLCITFSLLILVLAAGGTFVYMYLRQTEPTPTPIPSPSTTPLPNRTVDFPLFERAIFSMSLCEENSSEVRVLLSNHKGDTELLSTSNVQNGNETIFVIDDFLSTVTVSFNGSMVLALVTIDEFRCKHAGRYKLVVRPEDGSVEETELIVTVRQDGYGCPCTAGRSTGKRGRIECTFPLKSIQTVTVRKQNTGEQHILLSNYSISQGSNTTAVLESNQSTSFNTQLFYYKETTSDVLGIEFAPTLCIDKGVYNIVLIQAGKEVEYEIYFEVYSNPQGPDIFIEASGGLVEGASYPRGSESGDGGFINCVAPATGCFDVTLTIMKTDPRSDNPDLFHPVTDGNGMIKTSTKLGMFGWNMSAILTLYTSQLRINVHLSKYKCQYTYKEKTMESDVVTAYVIPANYCKGRKRNCLYHHPFVCNKFISCGAIPYEQPCHKRQHAQQHFMKIDECNGHCAWPEIANCTNEQ